jgi:hypothetical protein
VCAGGQNPPAGARRIVEAPRAAVVGRSERPKISLSDTRKAALIVSAIGLAEGCWLLRLVA